MSRDLLDLVRELNTLNDDNLADRVIENSDVQWCLSELQDILEEMPTLTPPNEWVSVEERLPEKKQDVLMLFKSGNMAVGWWHDSDEYITFWCAYTDDGFYTDCDDIPVYWMLLPAPPAKEDQK